MNADQIRRNPCSSAQSGVIRVKAFQKLTHPLPFAAYATEVVGAADWVFELPEALVLNVFNADDADCTDGRGSNPKKSVFIRAIRGNSR